MKDAHHSLYHDILTYTSQPKTAALTDYIQNPYTPQSLFKKKISSSSELLYNNPLFEGQL